MTTEISPFGIKIPDEVTLGIFKYFEPKDIAIASVVCKYFLSISSDNLLWKSCYVKDFPQESNSSNQIESYKQRYKLAKEAQKICALEADLEFFAKALDYSIDENTNNNETSTEKYQRLFNCLFDSYFCYINYDYTKLGKIFDFKSERFENNGENKHFEIRDLERNKILYILFKRSIESFSTLHLDQDRESHHGGLQPSQKQLLQQFFAEISGPIVFSLSNFGVSNDDIPLISGWIEQGKICTLVLDGNNIDDKGLCQLQKSAKHSQSQLKILSLFGNTLKKTNEHYFEFNPRKKSAM